MKNLSEKAILVNLSISLWSARKYDHSVSVEIENQHNAHNAGRFNKILIAEKELKAVKSIGSNARNFLYNNTLPWGDNGDRLLPSANYFKFLEDFKEYKDNFYAAAEEFFAQYPALKEDAKIRLNGMFREADYPTTAIIKTKFDIDISFMPISEVEDFRLKVNEEEVNHLKGRIEQEINTRIIKGIKNMYGRIHEEVGHMLAKLSDQEGVFRDSLVENIRELIDLLPRLNITEDEEIKATIQEMKYLLVDPDTLRTDAVLRNQTAQEAKAILEKISDYLD